MNMSSKIIEYDLQQPGTDYNALYKAIKEYGVWAHVTESTWIIKTDESCVAVRNKLIKLMDENDRLFVGELSGEAAWHNTICSNQSLKGSL